MLRWQAVGTPRGCIPLLTEPEPSPWTRGQGKLIRNLRFFHVLCNLQPTLSSLLALTSFIHSQDRHGPSPSSALHAASPGWTHEQGQGIRLGWQKSREWWETPDPDWEGAENQAMLPGGGA